MKKKKTLYDLSSITPKGTFKDVSKVTLEEIAQAIYDGKVDSFKKGTIAKIIRDENGEHITIYGVLKGTSEFANFISFFI